MGERNDAMSIGFACLCMMIASRLDRYMASRRSQHSLQDLSDEALADLGLRRRPFDGEVCPLSEFSHSDRT